MQQVHRNPALERARVSLEGLSVGDALGEKFFFSHGVEEAIVERRLPERPWYWTDDTAMALSVYECLEAHGTIVQDDLIKRFVRRYEQDLMRGYGAGTRRLINDIKDGQAWQTATLETFSGMGSFGNGAAMRVSPLGAYFADDLERVIREAKLSAEVTHAHPEGIAGAIAVAVATALAVHQSRNNLSRQDFITAVAENVPESEVRSKILRTAKYTDHTPIDTAIAQLGVGYEITAQDTVPFCIWCAAKHLENFEEAIWYTVSGLGDRDTTSAIVGGIVAARVGLEGIPQAWREAREDFWV
jgi:ADP-ribosylglycohydrolase